MEKEKPPYVYFPYMNPLITPTAPSDATTMVTAMTTSGNPSSDVGGGGGGEWPPPQQIAFPGMGMGMGMGVGVDAGGSAGSSSTMIFAQSSRMTRDGDGREAVDAVQVQVESRHFSFPPPPPHHHHHLPPMQPPPPPPPPPSLPGIYEGWRLEPIKYPYAFQGLPYFNGSLSNVGWPNLKRKADSPCLPFNFDNLFFRKECSPGATSSSCANPGVASFPLQNLSASVQKESDSKDTPGDFISANLVEETSPSRGSKSIRQVHASSLAWSFPLHGKNSCLSQVSPDHTSGSWEQNLLELSPLPRHNPHSELGARDQVATSFCKLPDDKELEDRGWLKVLQKELKNSDVSSLGRIVLPKREAEKNLPPLIEKDGLMLHIVDMEFPIMWTFKYRFWPNNKSRMYVMEYTGDFVKTHKLKTGDFFIIYREQNSGNYIARAKKVNVQSTIDDSKPDGNDPRSLECSAGNGQLLDSGLDMHASEQMQRAFPFQF